MNVRAGDVWGAVRCTGVHSKQVVEKEGAVTDTYYKKMIVLSCACGKEIEVEAAQFPGKKAMQDCGCGAARAEALGELKTVVSFAIAGRLAAKLDNIAHDMNKSRVPLGRSPGPRITRSSLCAQFVEAALAEFDL